MEEVLIGAERQLIPCLRINNFMNNIQKEIQGMVLDLFRALESYPYPRGGIDDALLIMAGINDGSFFDLPFEVHSGKLGWLNGAFFGKGERAFPLFDANLLPGDFDAVFNKVLHEYWERGEKD